MDGSYIRFLIYIEDENHVLERRSKDIQFVKRTDLNDVEFLKLVKAKLVEESKDVFEDEECLLDPRPQKIDIYRVYDLSSF